MEALYSSEISPHTRPELHRVTYQKALLFLTHCHVLVTTHVAEHAAVAVTPETCTLEVLVSNLG
jgi:hypothetical protein